MQLPTLHQLEIFTKVAALHSFTRAAQELYLSAPSVSLQIQHLERSYGTALFKRTGRGPELTEAGIILLEAASTALTALREAGAAIDHGAEPDRRRVSVGATNDAGVYILPFAVTVYRRRYPQTEVNLIVSEAEQIEQALLRETIEVGVLRTMQSTHLRAEALDLEDLVLLLHVDNPLARADAIYARDLAGQKLLVREGSRTRDAVLKCIEEGALTAAELVEVKGVEHLIEAVGAGRGIAFGSPSFVTTEGSWKSIVTRPVQDLSISVSFQLAYLAERPLSEAARDFIDTCKTVSWADRVLRAS